MTELTIRRLTATAPPDPLDAGRGPRVRRMLANLATRRLGDALKATSLPPGDWCIRRLDVAVPVDLDRPDPAVEVDWAATLVAALTGAAAGGSADVVHYPRTADALADLVAELAAGRADRAWAWAQLRLVPADVTAPADAVLAALRAHPAHALAVVARVARTGSVAALHRLFGQVGWTELARITAGAVGCAVPGPDGPEPVAAGLVATLVARSTLAARFAQAGLRVDGATATAWATLAAVEADPSALRRATAPAVLRALARTWADASSSPGLVPRSGSAYRAAVATQDAAGGGAATGRPDDLHRPTGLTAAVATWTGAARGTGSGGAEATDDRRAPARATPRPPNRIGDPEPAHAVAGPAHAVDDPAGDTGEHRPDHDRRARWPTPWAGLLFLIATADEAGIPGGPIADPALATRPSWWALHRIAQHLAPAPADDPAVLALAGLRPDEARLVEQAGLVGAAPPRPPELRSIRAHAQRWSAATARRLSPLHPGDDPVPAAVRRAGELLVEPGWIDVCLHLADVDLDVRRAGLDVDPGWVPWLGAVVRYVYA